MSDFKEFKAHFPQKISKSLARYVTDTVLKESRYLFFKTVMGIQFAHCTHCNKRHRSEVKLKHKQKEKVTCPHCKSSCYVRADGVSRKYMTDKCVLVWYEKSVVDPKAITARVIGVYRDYSGSYENIETEYNAGHMYLFESGKSQYWDWKEHRKSVFSAFDSRFGGYKRFVSHGNIRSAVKGTSFQYSTWEDFIKYQNSSYVSDMVEFFDLAARYPCVEYLSKLGFKKIIWTKLYRNSTLNAVNWRGKTIEKVLRLDKSSINEIRQSGRKWGPQELKFFQDLRKKGYPFTAVDAFDLSDIDRGQHSHIFKENKAYASEETIMRYLLKQFRRGSRSSLSSVAYDFKDYLKQCKELGMSLKEERYLFPNDLHEAHQKLTAMIKHKKNEKLDQLLNKRIAELKKMYFEASGIFIRAVESVDELFDEGKRLNHCVGGYAESYVNARTDLFVLRELSDPDKPYYTLQVTDKRFIQCRGLKNCNMTDEVKIVVDSFMEQLNKKSKKSGRLNRPANRQEAVV